MPEAATEIRAAARARISQLRRQMLRRLRLQMQLLLGVSAAALIIVPLLSFSLGRLSETELTAIFLAAFAGALILGEALSRSLAPSLNQAAEKLDAGSGRRALFATALDQQLDSLQSPVTALYLLQLAKATEALRGQDVLGRPDRRFLKLFLLLLALNAGLLAMPRAPTESRSAELAKIQDYLTTAATTKSLDETQQEALQDLAKTGDPTEFRSKLDQTWAQNQAALNSALELEKLVDAALRQLEAALEKGQDAAFQKSLTDIAKLLEALDRDAAKSLAERLRALAEAADPSQEPKLDSLAEAAAGAGAGLSGSTEASRLEANRELKSIMLALYDGLGDQPPSGLLGRSNLDPQPNRGPESPQKPVDLRLRDLQVSPAEKALIERYFRFLPR